MEHHDSNWLAQDLTENSWSSSSCRWRMCVDYY